MVNGLTEASFKDIPEIFEVRLKLSLQNCCSRLSQVELGESLTARTESLCACPRILCCSSLTPAFSFISRIRTSRLVSCCEEYRPSGFTRRMCKLCYNRANANTCVVWFIPLRFGRRCIILRISSRVHQLVNLLDRRQLGLVLENTAVQG